MADKSSLEKIADDHINWYFSRFELQQECFTKIMKQLARDNFIHGYKHGIEHMEEIFGTKKDES